MDLHPEAERAFNLRAAALASSWRTRQRIVGQPSGFIPRPFASPIDAIWPLLVETHDVTGDQGSLYWEHEDGRCEGLWAPAYLELARLVESAQRVRGVSAALSSKFVKDNLFNWLTLQQKSATESSWCQHLTAAADQSVKTVTVMIPIHRLYLESAFKLGRMTFAPLTAEMFDRWSHQAAASRSAEVVSVLEFLRRDHQGTAAALITLTAEPNRARELAHDFADETLNVLRLCQPTMYHPELVSACVAYGSQYEPMRRSLILSNDGLPVLQDDGFLFRPEQWILSSTEIRELSGLAWAAFNGALAKDSAQRSDLERAVMDSVRLYTVGCTKFELSDRLLYTFAALESLLLRDSREPLAQNIGDRLAFTVEKTAERRRQIVALVRNVYDTRSRFVHHGDRIEDTQTVEKFLRIVWQFFVVYLPRALVRLQTKQALIDEIEQEKYS
jgi:hypothetical protein